MTGSTPTYYTEVNGVMNTTVFAAFDHNGASVTITPSASASDLADVTAIEITLSVQSSQADPKSGKFPTTNVVSTAEIRD